MIDKSDSEFDCAVINAALKKIKEFPNRFTQKKGKLIKNPKLSDKTVAKVKRIINDPRARVYIALSLVTLFTGVGVLWSKMQYEQALRAIDTANPATHEAFSKSIDNKNSAYEEMLSDDKINTISELEKLAQKGYNIYEIFGIPQNYFDQLSFLKYKYEKALNGETFQLSENDINELGELAQVILESKFESLEHEISPEATSFGFGHSEVDEEAYFVIDKEKMPISDGVKEMIDFASFLSGNELGKKVGKMRPEDQAHWFYTSMEGIQKLATSRFEILKGKNGKIEGIFSRQYIISNIEELPGKPDKTHGLNIDEEDIEEELDFYEQ